MTIGPVVDLVELRRRVRRRLRNPWLRALHYVAVELHPRDERWWAGRAVRSATVYLDPLDAATVEYVRTLSPHAVTRLAALLADALDVNEVRLTVRTPGVPRGPVEK